MMFSTIAPIFFVSSHTSSAFHAVAVSRELPKVQQLMVVETPAELRADTQRPDPNRAASYPGKPAPKPGDRDGQITAQEMDEHLEKLKYVQIPIGSPDLRAFARVSPGILKVYRTEQQKAKSGAIPATAGTPVIDEYHIDFWSDRYVPHSAKYKFLSQTLAEMAKLTKKSQ
jgi:hypothetical protein